MGGKSSKRSAPGRYQQSSFLNRHKHMNRHVALKAMVVGALILRKDQGKNLQK